MFRLPKMRTHPFIPEGVSSELAEIIVSWSLLDKTIDMLRGAFAVQPECTGIAPARRLHFRSRATHFRDLSVAYFASCPATSKFLDRVYNSLLNIQDERDLIAHGRYGLVMHGGSDFSLTLAGNIRGQHTTKHYTPSELEDLAQRMTRHFAVLKVLSDPQLLTEFPDIWVSQWKIPQPQAERSQKLLDRIHSHCQNTILQQFPQLPEGFGMASVFDPTCTIVPKSET